MTRPTKMLWIAALVFISVGVLMLVQKQRASASQHELANIIPQIAAITLYDVGIGVPRDSNALASAISASFPIDVFSRAASSAIHKGGITIWMGSSLAVITLRDGTRRYARFSYYGGFFTVEGTTGRFVVLGAGGSEFQRSFDHLMLEQIVPKRRERNTSRSA